MVAKRIPSFLPKLYLYSCFCLAISVIHQRHIKTRRDIYCVITTTLVVRSTEPVSGLMGSILFTVAYLLTNQNIVCEWAYGDEIGQKLVENEDTIGSCSVQEGNAREKRDKTGWCTKLPDCTKLGGLTLMPDEYDKLCKIFDHRR